MLGAVVFRMKSEGVSWPHVDEGDALWLFTEQTCLRLPASFTHLLPGSVPLHGVVRHPVEDGWREGKHGLIPTVDMGIFSLPLDGQFLSAAPLSFISARS